MKKLLVLLVLLVSGLGFSQRNTDTTTHHPMFYGMNTYGSFVGNDTTFHRFLGIIREAEYKLLNEWYKENIHLVYEEFIRLVNEERSHLTVNKKFVIYLDEHDYNSTYEGFAERGDSVLLITNKKEAKKLSKQIQEEYNVVDVHTDKIRLGNYVGDRIWIEYVTPVNKIKFDSLTSLAALHLNKFYINESNSVNEDWKMHAVSHLFGHHEIDDYYPYHDTVLCFPKDRVKHFTNDTRVWYSEIIANLNLQGVKFVDGEWTEPIFDYEVKEVYDANYNNGSNYRVSTKINNNPYKRIAEELFTKFKNSPKHYDIILSEWNYSLVGLNLIFDCHYWGFFTVDFVKEKK
jgi:hypothetical protein